MRLLGELEEMGQRLAAAATLTAVAAVAVPETTDHSSEGGEGKGREKLAMAAEHIRMLQEKLEALVGGHRLLVRKHRAVEGELHEAKAQVGLRDERIRQLEDAQCELERAVRRQEGQHITELEALREQVLKAAGALIGRGGGGGGGGQGVMERLKSTSSFGDVNDDEADGSSMALLGRTSSCSSSLSLGLGGVTPRTIRGGTKASLTCPQHDLMAASIGGSIGGSGVLGSPRPFSQRSTVTTTTTGPLPWGATEDEKSGGGENGGGGGGILSLLREGILGTIMASPL